MSLNVAIIDRDPAVVAVILQHLSALGLDGRVCSAAELAGVHTNAEMVFVDLYNPEKEGIETIMDLRARRPGLTIVAMAHGLRNVPAGAILELALGLGADHGLAKPIAPLALDSILAKVLAGRVEPQGGAAGEARSTRTRRPRWRERADRGGAPAGSRVAF